MQTISELQSCINKAGAGVYASLKKKEAKAILPSISEDETLLMLFPAVDKNNNSKKIILTNKKFIIITPKAFRTPQIEILSLNSIYDAQKQSGILFATLFLILQNETIIFKIPSKDIVEKVIELLRNLREQVQSSSAERTQQLEKLFDLKQKGAITDEEYEKEKKNILNIQVHSEEIVNNVPKIASNVPTQSKKKSGCMGLLLKITGILFLLALAMPFLSSNPKNETDNTSTAPVFVPSYNVLKEDNLTLGGVPRFRQEISVPLGLSTEELKQNLLDAAWKLQKQKDASAVVIFAFREDDKKRDSGYSAGKCTVAPFGDWAKAMEKHKTSDLQAVIDVSDAYSYNEPIRENGSSAFVKDANTELYKPDTKEFYAEDVIARLKKGTEVKIIGHQRNIGLAVMDIYKVQVNLDKKRSRTGWIYGYKLVDKR